MYNSQFFIQLEKLDLLVLIITIEIFETHFFPVNFEFRISTEQIELFRLNLVC